VSGLEQPFRGTWALVASKRRVLLGFPLLLGLLPVLLGVGLWVLSSSGERTRDDGALFDLLVAGTWIAALTAPLCAGAWLTFGLSATGGARCRREELLVLPIGRLAPPLAVLAISAATLALWAAVTYGALALVLTVEPLQGAWAIGQEGRFVRGAGLWTIPAAWALVTAVGALGNSTSMVAVIWPLLPMLLGAAAANVGYSSDLAMPAHVLLWSAALGGYYLVLPFALYALPRSAWADRDTKLDPGGPAAHLVALLGLVAWAFLGLLAAALLTGLGALALRRSCKSTTGAAPRSLRTTPWVALLVALPFVLPALALELALDARLAALAACGPRRDRDRPFAGGR